MDELWLKKHWMGVALLLVSGAFHFLYLTSPRQVIFDEVHFGKFVSSYCCTGQRIFDIHPPHAKLLIASAVAVTSYPGTFPFEHIGQAYSVDVPVGAFRTIPALCGTLLPLLIFMLLKQLGVSPRFALLGGMAVLFENALLLQTRIIALDGILLVATFGALVAALAAQRKQSYVYWIVAGCLAGLAVGVKFTGLMVLGLLFLILLLAWWKEPTKKGSARFFYAGLIVLAAAVFIYLGGWYLHFSLLTQPGSGDVWQIPTGNFWNDLVTIHKQMLSANYNLSGTHPYSSAWWTWPLMLRPVFYWQGGAQMMYFIGNPVVWWGILLSMIFLVVRVVGDARDRRRISHWLATSGWLVVVGYIASYGPLINVPRVLFLYHYATPLLFSLLFVVAGLDIVVTEEVHRRRLFGIAIVCMAAGFILFSPLTFGFALPSALTQSLFWLPGWR